MITPNLSTSVGSAAATTQAGIELLKEQPLKIEVKWAPLPDSRCYAVTFIYSPRFTLSATLFQSAFSGQTFTARPGYQGSSPMDSKDLPIYAMFILDCHRRLTAATKDGKLFLEALNQ